MLHDILPLMPFSTINSISISVNNSNFISVIFKAACHAKPGAGRNFTASKLETSQHIFPKFSKTSVRINVPLLRY